MRSKTRVIVATLIAAGMSFTASGGDACVADLNSDGEVGFDDLLVVLSEWGRCPGCASDLDGDGITDFGDLLEVLSAWGPCPEAGFTVAELAGVLLPAFPYLDRVTTFNEGDAIRVGLDPSQFPDLVNRPCLMWIVEDRTAAAWDTDPLLTDVRGVPEGTVFTGPGFADSIMPIGDSLLLSGDAGTTFGVGYDVVLDFDLDGQLGPGDVIDGYGDVAGFYMVKDPATPGPLETSDVTYEGDGSFLGQRTFYPTDIGSMGQLPLVVISHGNGHQYTWYNYLGHHLASWGYVVMSHQNNTMPGIETAAVSTLQNTDYLLSNLDTIAGGVLEGHVDGSQIVWIGHSRGGEGVVRAYDRLIDGSWTADAFDETDIVLVSSIAPTDFLGTDDADPHGVDYHLLYGAADGDVSGDPDCDICQSFHLYERATGSRAATYVQGADHNDFNCCGFNDYDGPADDEIGRDEAQLVAMETYRVLLAEVIEASPAALEYLWRQHENLRSPSVSPQTVVDRELRTFAAFVIEDYQSNSSLATSSSGENVSFSVEALVEDFLDDGNTSFTWTPTDPMNGMTRGRPSDTTRGAVFEYQTNSFLEFDVAAGAQDMTSFSWLAFRACQGTRHPFTLASAADQNFAVRLQDASGTTASIQMNVFRGGVEETFRRAGAGAGIGWQNEFETIRLRLTDFAADGTGLDLSAITKIRFQFGSNFGQPEGRIGFDDLELLR